MTDYKKIAIEMPPLEVQIVVRKSTYKIYNEARVDILSAHDASQEWHCGDLLAHGFDEWMFVNPEDEYEWEAKLTARCG
tara:strand:- start:11158 stop:11394 length:237 start_codon:yes stop_codon:yes gene_type:complete